MPCPFCESVALESVVFRAVRVASEQFVRQPGATSIIRNGGWEGSFRNQIMVALELQNPHMLGFTEGSDRPTARVDLMVRCMECKKMTFGIETKINFHTQGEPEAVKQLEDGFAKASRLAESGSSTRAFIVHAIADLWNAGSDPRAGQHNDVVTRSSSSYKRFEDQDPQIARRQVDRNCSPIRRWIWEDPQWNQCEGVCIHPEGSTLCVPEESQSKFGTRLRIWIAEVCGGNDKEFKMKFLGKEGIFNADEASLALGELVKIRDRKTDRTRMRWSAKSPRVPRGFRESVTAAFNR